MRFFDQNFVGYFTLAAGISALIQIILLILMFTVSRTFFGTLSDYFYALTPLLLLPFVIAFPKILGIQNTGIYRIAMISGVTGILIASMAQVILLIKIIDLKQSIWGNLIGLGLVGILILTMTILNHNNPELPASFQWFGMVLGIAMVIGIPSGFFFLDELHAVQNGSLAWSSASPLIYPAVLAGVITQIGLPVWGFWTAQLVLTGKLNILTG